MMTIMMKIIIKIIGTIIMKIMMTIIAMIVIVAKATVTPVRTIYGSYDWLRWGHGATDRQCLLRSPAAVAYGDQSLRVIALPQTIGEYRWLEPS